MASRILRVMLPAMAAIETSAASPDDPRDVGAPIEVPFEQAIDRWLELYVDPAGGNDFGNDGSIGAPLRTLAAAVSSALRQTSPEPTRIHLAAGDYGGLGTYVDIRRAAASPIVVSGATDAHGEPLTVVEGGASGFDGDGALCLRLSSVTYIVVENIRCQNAFPHGVNIDDGGDHTTPTHHVVIRNWRIQNVGIFLDSAAAGNSDCIKLSGVDDFWIIASELENCVEGEFIDMVGAHRGVIARNYFHDKPGNGIQAKGGSADITIARNTLERVQQRFIQLGGSADPEFYRPSTAPYPASRITVIANIVRGVGVFDGRDVHRSVVFSLNGCNDCLVAHNTVLEIQFQATLVYIDKEDPNRPGNNDITLANNIFVMNDNADRGRSLAGNRFEFRVSPRGEPTASEVLFENEIYFDADAPTKKPIDVPPALRPEQFVGVGVFDPQLDASARPRVTSPALAFGATGHQTRVLGDYLGAPYGSPPAAGAFASPSSGDEPPAE